MKSFFTAFALAITILSVTAQTQVLLETESYTFTSMFEIDFNNDGVMDYGAFQEGDLFLFENNGTEVWANRTLFTLTEPGDILSAIVLDLNADGYQDILYKSYNHSDLHSFVNPGSTAGSWESSLLLENIGRLIGFFDVDCDTDKDIVYENSSTYLKWAENSGGVFSITHSITDTYPSIYLWVVQDFDNDGDMDWAAYFYDCCITYFKNNSDGTFSTESISTDEYQNTLETVDVNADGYTDIVYQYSTEIYVAVFDTASSSFESEVFWDYSPSYDYVHFYTHDIDGDADDDVLYFASSLGVKSLWWIENTGAEVTLDDAEILADTLYDDASYYWLSDYNTDGQPDIFTIQDNVLEIHVNDYPSNTFSEIIQPSQYSSPVFLFSLIHADNNSYHDIVSVTEHGEIYLFLFDSSSAAYSAITEIENIPNPGAPVSMAVHDLNGDLQDDFIISFESYTGQLSTYYYLNNGTGLFTRYLLMDNGAFTDFNFTDADADGDVDVIAIKYMDYAEKLCLIISDITDPTGILHMHSYLSDEDWKDIELLDIDNDGDEDIAGINTTTPDILMLMNSDGSAGFDDAGGFIATFPFSVSGLLVTDMDADDDEDIMYYISSDNTTYIATNDAGTFETISTGEFSDVFSGDAMKSIADMNNDGFNDLCVSDNTSGTFIKLSDTLASLEDTYYSYATSRGMFTCIDDNPFSDFIATTNYALSVQFNIFLSDPVYQIDEPELANLLEAGGADSLGMWFTQIPTQAYSVTINPDEPIDAGSGEGVPVTLTFAADSSALIPQYITLRVPDDAVAEDLIISNVTFTDDASWGIFAGSINETYTYVISDNDLGLFFDYSYPAYLTEGSSATPYVWFHINVIPSSEAVMYIDPGTDLLINSSSGISIISFHPDESALESKYFSAKAEGDYYDEPDTVTSAIIYFTSDDSTFEDYEPIELFWNILDNNTSNITRSYPASESFLEGVEEFTFTLNINTIPYNDVFVTAYPDIQLDLGAGAGVPVSFTFYASAIGPESLSFTGMPVLDMAGEGYHNGVVSFEVTSEDAYYEGETVLNATIHITDNTGTPDAIESINIQWAEIYPALNTGLFNITSSETEYDMVIHILNMNGENVFETILAPQQAKTVDLTNHADGSYIISMMMNGEIRTQKIQIIR